MTKRAEKSGFLRNVIESMNDPVFVTDRDGKFLYVCPNVVRATGLPAAEFEKAGLASRMFSPDPAQLLSDLPDAEVTNIPVRILGNTESHVDLLMTVRRCDIDGETLLYVGRSFNSFDFAQNMLHRMFWQSQDAIIFVARNNRLILNCNPAAADLFGCERADLMGESTESLHLNHEQFALYGDVVLADLDKFGHAQCEWQMRHKDGRALDVAITTIEVTGSERQGVGYISIMHDITRRREAQDAVALINGIMSRIASCRRPEDAYLPLLQAICTKSGWSAGEVWVPDGNSGKFRRLAQIAVTDAATDYLALTDGELVSGDDPLVCEAWNMRTPRELSGSDLASGRHSFLADLALRCGLSPVSAIPLMANDKTQAVMTFYAEERSAREQSWLDAIETAITPFSALVARVEMEAKLREKEAEARQSQDELRLLSQHIEKLRESERSELARELHDQLGSDLTGLKFQLSAAAAAGDNLDLRDECGAKTAGIVDTMIATIRNMATRLRPAVLDDYGLGAGLELLVRQFAERSDCDIECSIGENLPALDAEDTTALFRVCQESLTNVIRHSRANSVRVDMLANADTVVLTIADNGRGITPDASRHTARLGILGMRERMHGVGGSFEVSGFPGAGTIVRAVLPVTSKANRGGAKIV